MFWLSFVEGYLVFMMGFLSFLDLVLARGMGNKSTTHAHTNTITDNTDVHLVLHSHSVNIGNVMTYNKNESIMKVCAYELPSYPMGMLKTVG